MKEIKYIVRKQFKYSGHWYMPGEEWEPDGSKFDKIIIDQHRLVETVTVGAEKKKTPRRRAKQT